MGGLAGHRARSSDWSRSSPRPRRGGRGAWVRAPRRHAPGVASRRRAGVSDAIGHSTGGRPRRHPKRCTGGAGAAHRTPRLSVRPREGVLIGGWREKCKFAERGRRSCGVRLPRRRPRQQHGAQRATQHAPARRRRARGPRLPAHLERTGPKAGARWVRRSRGVPAPRLPAPDPGQRTIASPTGYPELNSGSPRYPHTRATGGLFYNVLAKRARETAKVCQS